MDRHWTHSDLIRETLDLHRGVITVDEWLPIFRRYRVYFQAELEGVVWKRRWGELATLFRVVWQVSPMEGLEDLYRECLHHPQLMPNGCDALGICYRHLQTDPERVAEMIRVLDLRGYTGKHNHNLALQWATAEIWRVVDQMLPIQEHDVDRYASNANRAVLEEIYREHRTWLPDRRWLYHAYSRGSLAMVRELNEQMPVVALSTRRSARLLHRICRLREDEQTTLQLLQLYLRKHSRLSDTCGETLLRSIQKVALPGVIAKVSELWGVTASPKAVDQAVRLTTMRQTIHSPTVRPILNDAADQRYFQLLLLADLGDQRLVQQMEAWEYTLYSLVEETLARSAHYGRVESINVLRSIDALGGYWPGELLVIGREVWLLGSYPPSPHLHAVGPYLCSYPHERLPVYLTHWPRSRAKSAKSVVC